MIITHLNCRTICLIACLTTLLLAGSVQTVDARERTTFGFYIGMHDNDSRWHHYRNDYRRGYTRRYYSDPRFTSPSYNRWGYYHRWDYPYRYRRDYYTHHHDSDRFIAMATGVFFGVLIGSEIIRYMNDVDHLRARQATLRAQTAPIGSRITWNNPQTDNYGSVTATRDGYTDSGKYCREFYQTVSIGGRPQDAYGVACHQPDGNWRIIQ